MYERKIAHLQEAHKSLEQKLVEAEHSGASTEEIQTIKKRKLRAKDLIRELTDFDNSGREFK